MGAGANGDGAYTREPRKDGTILQLWNWQEPYPEGQAKQFRTTLTTFERGGLEITQVRDTVLRFSEPVHMEPASRFDTNTKDASKLEKVPDIWTFGSILEARNGNLLATMCYRLEREPKYYRSMLLRSADQGKTWAEFSAIAAVERGDEPWPGMGEDGPTETAIVRLADGRLYAIFRTGASGFLGNAWSRDDGKTWSRPVSTPFKGVAPRLRRLSNGVLACTYGRPGPVTVIFSVDGSAEKWSHGTEVFKGMSTRYTDLLEVEPGKLFVVYDSVPYGWHEIPHSDRKAKNTIYGTFVEVQRTK
jgi:hypothetical protein